MYITRDPIASSTVVIQYSAAMVVYENSEMSEIYKDKDIKILYVKSLDRIQLTKGNDWIGLGVPTWDILLAIWESYNFYANTKRTYDKVTVVQNGSDFTITRLYTAIALTFKSNNFSKIITLNRSEMDKIYNMADEIAARILYEQTRPNDCDGSNANEPEWPLRIQGSRYTRLNNTSTNTKTGLIPNACDSAHTLEFSKNIGE